MRVLGVIPARGGSKRVPGKNLRKIGGKPLVAHTIQAAQGCPRLTRLVVSSDDEQTLEIARSYSKLLPLRRPAELATDVAPAIAYVRHALSVLEQESAERFDTVAIMQCSSPFTLAEDITSTIDLLQTTGADSAVSVVQVAHAVHPLKLKTLDGDRLLPFLEEERGRMAAEDLPPVYVRNCAVYVARRSNIDAGTIIGKDCRAYLMPRERSVDINDELDFRFAEFLFERVLGRTLG